jgi:hypothetical protein
MLFMKTELEKQIKQYVAHKARDYPHLASRDEVILMQFFKTYKLPNATLISSFHVQDFVNRQNSVHYQQKYLKTLRGFMRYWYKLGLLSSEFASVVKSDIIADMEQVSPLLHVEQVKRVQSLRAKGMTFRQIKVLMEGEDKRTYDVHSLHRWANRKLSTS